jgi:hypothetical protein
MRVLTAWVERGTGGAANPDTGISSAIASPRTGTRRNPYLDATRGSYHGLGHAKLERRTRMKSLGASFLLVALLTVAQPAGADSIYMGTLTANQPFVLNIDNGLIAAGKTAVTVLHYLAGGRPSTQFDVHVVAAGARESFTHVIPKGARLTTIELAPPWLTSVNVEITQGATSFNHTCEHSCKLTFDLQ